MAFNQSRTRVIGRGSKSHGHRESDLLSKGLALNNLNSLDAILPKITRELLKTMEIIHRALRDSPIQDPLSAFESITIGERKKPALAVDLFVERLAAMELERRLRRFSPLILGEESLRNKDLDLTHENRLVILLDALDGTDLYERGLGNWCSAAVAYLPALKQILGAFVGTPEGLVFYWTPNLLKPVRYDLLTKRSQPVQGPSAVQSIENASLAFYGQKVSSLRSNTSPFTNERNANLHSNGLGLRVYNLAGIPAMVRTVDVIGGRRMDAVFELSGQLPHDVVAGAVIAQSAGATLVDLNGEPLDLGLSLLRPADVDRKLTYIIASTSELASDLLQYLRPSPTDRGPAEAGRLAA